MITCRVVSYNVRSLRDDAAAVAATLRALEVDLAVVQEAPRLWRSAASCRALAEAAGLRVLTGGRASAGNLILGAKRVGPVGTGRLRLPRQGRRHRRAVALAVVDIDGVRLAVAGSHLSLDPLERRAQARRVAAWLGRQRRERSATHLVLGVDVNDVPGSPAWLALTEQLRDAHALTPVGGGATFPARGPDRRLDAVFVSADVGVLGCGVPPGLIDPARATDHLPVLAELTLPQVTER